MLMRARWFAVVALAAGLPLLPLSWGCQGTCSSGDDCNADEYCSLATGACLAPKPLGFCKERPSSCTAVSELVCGCDGKPYTNACEASRAGVSVANTGACSVTCGGPDALPCPAGQYCKAADGLCSTATSTGTCDLPPTSCDTAPSSPVCGCDGKTYPSLCAAQAASVSVAATGDCTCGGAGNVACADTKQYCDFAVGTCTEAAPSGTCKTPPETCSSVSSPVCGCDNRTYDNECKAAQAKVPLFATGDCPCGGSDNTPCEPGRFCSLMSGACLNPAAEGTCKPKPTTCPDVSSPVCGCDGITYDNTCLASKAGVSVVGTGECKSIDGGA
jgi:hypothetical protein